MTYQGRRDLTAKEHLDRFWSKVDKSGGPDACWPWLAYRTDSGYGQCGVHGHTAQAHRVAYFLEYGPFDWALCVCHHCDNRACCNPRHLFLGTNRDNVQDAMLKGRRAKRLTEIEVLFICCWLDAGYTQAAIANRFDINPVTPSAIKTGRRWAWLTGRGQ